MNAAAGAAQPPSRARFRGLFLLMGLGAAALIARLYYLQDREGRMWHSTAVQLRETTLTSLPIRGALLDCHERALALSLYSGTADFDPKAFRAYVRLHHKSGQKGALLQAEAAEAAPELHLSQDTLLASMQQALQRYSLTKHRYFALQSGLSRGDAARLQKLGLGGFGVVDGYVRRYSYGADAAQAIGFLSSSGKGQAGLELGCSKWLQGSPGKSTVQMGADRREIPDTLHEISQAENGYSVHTSLDADVQQICNRAAQKIWQTYHPHGVTITVIDPSTGDILGLVSLPCYDADPLPSSPDKRPPIAVDELRERNTQWLYEPGSTIKPLLISGALDSGAINTGTTFYCSGEFKVGRRTIHCALGEKHGFVNPAKILRVSCNIGAAHIGLLLGAHKLRDIYQRFGLFSPLDIPLPGAERGRWSLDSIENAYSYQRAARAAFGQSVVTTPLALTMAYAAIANHGVLMKPRLITELTNGSGTVIKQWAPQAVRKAVSPAIADEVRQMLCGVVTSGTGTPAAVPGYWVAGKTGTATKYRPGAYVGSFMGMIPAGPASAVRAVILVAVDQPDTTDYYGSSVAAPAFQQIASQLMSLWNVPQDDPQKQQYTQAKKIPAQGSSASGD